MGSVAAYLFSGLSKDVWSGSIPDSGWATQGHSETCPEATPALSWLCAYDRCSVGKWTFAPVWGPECSGAGFHQGSLYFAPFIFPSIMTSLPVPATEKHPHSMMLPPQLWWQHHWCQVSSRCDAWHSGQRVQSLFHQTRESCFSWSESPLGAFWQTPKLFSLISGVLQRWSA